MTQFADPLLLIALMCGLFAASASRILDGIRAAAMQGLILAALPLFFLHEGSRAEWIHAGMAAAATAGIKAALIPWLLGRTLRKCRVVREAEPYVGFHMSLLVCVLLVALSFRIGRAMIVPVPPPSDLIFPVGFSLLMIGFVILINRKKAISEVVGFLILENGIYVCGLSLQGEMPFLVEMGALLDLLVGVFVMGIALKHINRAFDDIDAGMLSTLSG